jgi:hypothetical protein
MYLPLRVLHQISTKNSIEALLCCSLKTTRIFHVLISETNRLLVPLECHPRGLESSMPIMRIWLSIDYLYLHLQLEQQSE